MLRREFDVERIFVLQISVVKDLKALIHDTFNFMLLSIYDPKNLEKNRIFFNGHKNSNLCLNFARPCISHSKKKKCFEIRSIN